MKQCTNGHACDDDARFCDDCGTALQEESLSELADDAVWGAREPAADRPAAPGGALEARRGSGTVRGTARNVQLRSEPWGQGASRQILSMRVERYDPSGNRLQPVPVELTGWTLTGHVADGEEVAVDGRWSDGILRASRAVNLSTGGAIDTHRMRYLVIFAVGALVLVAFAIFMFTL